MNKNLIFNISSLIFILLGLAVLGFITTGDEVLFFAQDRNELINDIVKIITQFGEEPAYVLIFLFLLFLVGIRYALAIPFIGLLVTILSFSLKSFFKHPRPGLFFRDADRLSELELIEGVKLLTGQTSFPSGHTLSAFCLFGFLSYVLHLKKFHPFWQLACFGAALLVGFSRIYLAQHFLKDVVFGAFLGTMLSMLFIYIMEALSDSPSKWYNKTILSKTPAKA